MQLREAGATAAGFTAAGVALVGVAMAGVTIAGAAALAAHLALRQPPWAARLLAGQEVALFSVRTTSRRVAITIDDGPDERLTPGLLEVLEAHVARATFFVLGSGVDAHPALTSSIRGAGHEVGNHGWLDRPAVLLSRSAFRDDVVRTADTITRVTGVSPRFVRPGSGWLRPSHLRDVRAMGGTVALGSVAVLDLEVRDVDRELAFVLERVQPGAVIVLHEGRPERAGVVVLLDRLLTELTRRDYQCVTLSELVDPAER